jgi:hypothetical protein
MSYNDNFNPADNMDYSVSSDEFKKVTEGLKKSDKGYNVLWRMMPKNGRLKRTKIEVYTSTGYGCRIRDAETGHYYSHMVGTADEDLYFSVIISTGECRSENGSRTLFYLSPQHYMTHLNSELEPDVISRWEEKRDDRLNARTVRKAKTTLSTYVK